MGAAWITKTYWQYKLVVVNAWVDIPDEHELEAEAHAALHRSHSDDKAAKAPGKQSMWSAVMKGVSDAGNTGDGKVKTGNQRKGSSETDLPNVVKSDYGHDGEKAGTLLRLVRFLSLSGLQKPVNHTCVHYILLHFFVHIFLLCFRCITLYHTLFDGFLQTTL